MEVSTQISNRKFAQVILAAAILLLIIVAISGLKYFLSGFFGAITLYILFRKTYDKLTIKRGWKKSWASIFLIVVSLVCIVFPLWLLIEYMVPQAKSVIENRELIITKYEQVKQWMSDKPILNNIDISTDGLLKYLQKGIGYVPLVLGSVASLLTNIIVAFFVLYFMQVNNKMFEKWISLSIPFSPRSKSILWNEVNMMIRSNAIGIPVLGLCQAVVAFIGYMIFGVNNALLWGLLTGAATIIPVVGTMIIWVPICVVLLASGQTSDGLWLALYCLVVVGGIDNVLRFTILKQLGDVPPLITVFGVLLGLQFFGMMGLIFGPLMLSLIGVLYHVYRNEFGRRHELAQLIAKRKAEKKPKPVA